MDKPMTSFSFKIMARFFRVRDLIRPRMDLLKEVDMQTGYHVLDFGCGPGSYILPLSKLVGASGLIYALDIHPLAIEKVQQIASRHGLANVLTVQSDCYTGLPEESLDAILVYDVFHDLSQPDVTLRELHRILKPGGRLSFSDHHMKESDIIARVTGTNLFQMATKGKRTYTFSRINSQ